jgi:uncharacterized protein DUF1638
MKISDPIERNKKHIVVACGIMEPELDAVCKEIGNVKIIYLDQGLHRTPQNMAGLVQRNVDQAAKFADRIVLGYGLCSNGIVGVKAREQGLITPRSHDCISLFLGSSCAYKDIFENAPGTYFLTPGWVAEKKDPLSIVECDYASRFDWDTAVWVMREQLKHYTHIALIDTGVGDLTTLRQRAMENVWIFKKEYKEIKGNLKYFEKIARGPYRSNDFITLKPGESITQEMFFE